MAFESQVRQIVKMIYLEPAVFDTPSHTRAIILGAGYEKIVFYGYQVMDARSEYELDVAGQSAKGAKQQELMITFRLYVL